MSRPNVPGLHSTCDLYAALSAQPKPTSPAAIGVECRRLYRSGLRAREISSLLGIALPAVLEALRSTSATPTT